MTYLFKDKIIAQMTLSWQCLSQRFRHFLRTKNTVNMYNFFAKVNKKIKVSQGNSIKFRMPVNFGSIEHAFCTWNKKAPKWIIKCLTIFERKLKYRTKSSENREVFSATNIERFQTIIGLETAWMWWII